MIDQAAGPTRSGARVRLRSWLSTRHSLRDEAAVVLVLYGIYELGRGLVSGNAAEAERHAHRIVALERSLHLFVEANVQRTAHALPGFTSLLGIAYLTLHLAVTGGVLLWLHRHRPAAFPFVRTTLLLASGFSLVGFLAYPTAPPRLAGIGIADTISNNHVDLNHGLVSSLYNPYAAVPSMHVGYALIVAASLLHQGRSLLVRSLGALYPPTTSNPSPAYHSSELTATAASPRKARRVVSYPSTASVRWGEASMFPARRCRTLLQTPPRGSSPRARLGGDRRPPRRRTP